MFEDKRSKRVLLIAHCIFNQNAKIDRCAHYPGSLPEVAEVLIDAGVGIVQLPCPELLYLGLDRRVDRNAATTIESEDTRVAERMADAQGRALCRELAGQLGYQVEEYRKNGFDVIGLVGINGSPTCGVETTWSNGREEQGAGIFIQMLTAECHQKEVPLSMRGVKAYEPRRAVAVVMELLAGGASDVQNP